MPANLKETPKRCFHVNIVKPLRTLFYKTHLVAASVICKRLGFIKVIFPTSLTRVIFSNLVKPCEIKIRFENGYLQIRVNAFALIK